MMKVYNICGLKYVCVNSFKFYFMTLCVLLIAVCTSWFKINKTRMVFYIQQSMKFKDIKIVKTERFNPMPDGKLFPQI